MWDLSTAQEKIEQQRSTPDRTLGNGPTPAELIKSLAPCDLSSTGPELSSKASAGNTTASSSPQSSLSQPADVTTAQENQHFV